MAISFILMALVAWDLFVVSAAGAHLPSGPLLRNIYTFPPNHFIENIAVRSNSHLILTSMSVSTLFTLDPTVASPNVSVLHTFPDGHGLMGITELAPDLFVVISGIWDLALTRAALGSLTVWTVNLCSSTPSVTKVTTIATSVQLNGLAPVPGSNKLVLAADADVGAVYRINIQTGAYSITFSDPLFEPINRTLPGQHLGINGIRTRGSHLYFASSARQHFGRVAINALGDKIGPAIIISNNTVAGGAFGSQYDDFGLDAARNAWVATHPNHVVRVTPDGEQTVVEDTQLLLNPTSAQFGRGSAKERRTLYVTNGGWFTEDLTLINEGVVSLDTAQVARV
ncbi:uncharacterized protein L3040_001633 [Drepanopeziza brunnea f. sp. 'multigermtubi']|uniref:uncharacterized protein n=2 Tax=Drepanopeziza brunnea f. sp. 'multigermtubi' TaxID=698441 RepID=UPI002383B7E6|nr:hypothetical protein L3040_001633 [Drepanopeziza brunnea f. sp. 'multigermtubi']